MILYWYVHWFWITGYARADLGLNGSELNGPEPFNATLNVSGFYEEPPCRNRTGGAEARALGTLSAAGIAGITLGGALLVAGVSALSCALYRNRGLNRPQVLNDHCSNLDSSGYIDDTSDNSEEMYSLDNDSFLNSLEAMTIQNYWTDTVKHTKL